MEPQNQDEKVDFDGNQSPANYQTTTEQAFLHDTNGGTVAVLTWGIPLLAAMLLAAFILARRPWSAH